mmetsp:Transcript_10212/g.28119  ORF Transcript_10212/g.28119 Transcript_10212/m.28119 type:complete len:376 (+) Transcript_10212:250-1377(+)
MNEHGQHENQQPSRFQEIEGRQWFIYRQGMGRDDIPAGITHVLVEEGTMSIEDSAFDNSVRFRDGKHDLLQHVRLAKSVLQIGSQSFYYCINLVTVEIPNDSKLAEIGHHSFTCCESLTGNKMTFPASLRNIREFAFIHCYSLAKLSTHGDSNDPCQLEAIGEGCYHDCSAMKEVDLSHCPNLREINQVTFKRCSSLKTCLFPPHLEHILMRAFEMCTSLEEIVFPTTLQHIEYRAFRHCTQLKSLKFPASVQTVAGQAFQDCTALGPVEFESVASIDSSVFLECSGLHSITWPQDVIPCSLLPRLMARLFMGESGRFSMPEKNQTSCLFTFFRANHEMMSSNQRNAPALRRSSRRRQTMVRFGGGLVASKKKKA